MTTPAATVLTELLWTARQTGTPLEAVPPQAAITSEEEAYAVQGAIAARLGPRAGYKIGRKGAGAPVVHAPLFTTHWHASGVTLGARESRVFVVESELMFRFAHNLPARATPYTRAEIRAALSAVMPVFELVDSRYAFFPDMGPLYGLADNQSHAAMVVGAELPLPDREDWEALAFTYRVNGVVEKQGVGGNVVGDLIDVMQAAINAGLAIKAGECITTGSFTGMPVLPAGATAEAEFEGFGAVRLTRAG